MTGPEIIAKVKSLDLPKGSYIVFGSGPMAAVGIREADDIDFLVTPVQFEAFRALGWKQITKNDNDKPLVHDVFEAHDNWNFTSYQPTLEQLLLKALIIDNVPFASLEDVKAWKTAGARPKDLADLELIAKYQARSSN